MLVMPGGTTLAHGATGTWLDEFIQLGLPLILFAGLYFWSNRKAKAKAKAARRDDAGKAE